MLSKKRLFIRTEQMQVYCVTGSYLSVSLCPSFHLSSPALGSVCSTTPPVRVRQGITWLMCKRGIILDYGHG